MARNKRRRLGLFLAPLLCVVFVTSPTRSQETTTITSTTGPGDLGTMVTSQGNTTHITGGIRPGNGTNLFHSFNQFSVGPGETAQFLNTTPTIATINILSRVTGDHPSSIFGTIDTMSYPGANFFLVNPTGIVFGPSAMLQVGGSVAFTTADYLRLAEDHSANSGIFHADPRAASLLTSAPVTAFGFLYPDPAALAVHEGTLTVQPDRSISLVGGNQGFTYIDPDSGATAAVPGGVTVAGGHLVALDGQVSMASVASRGEILAKNLDQTGNINGDTFTTLGALQISQQSSIDTRGTSGGSIRIRGGHLLIDSSTLSSTAGEISVDTASIDITQGSTVMSETTTAANAGHITLNALRDISLDSEIRVASTSTDSSGHAGNIRLQSQQGNITVAHSSFVTTQSQMSSGNTGSINMDAPHGDILINDAHVFTSAQGTGTLGGIQITADNVLLQNGASIVGNNFTAQDAAPITITTNNRLNLTGGSVIETGTPGSANAADLLIRSHEIALSGSSLLITSTTGSGDAGQLRLFTDNLHLTDGGTLLSGSLVNPISGEIPAGRGEQISIQGHAEPAKSVHINGQGSGIITSAEGLGPAGNVSIHAQTLTLQNGGTISASTKGPASSAIGGSIIINATDQVTMTNGASITASSIVDPEIPNSGIANAGNVSLNAGRQLDVTNSSSITTTTESTQANGGNIAIRAIDRIQLVDSTVSTSVLGAAGSGGNIFIDPNVVILQGSEVTAKAVGGAGGNITFVTPLFLADSGSLVSASSERGPSGTVTIQSPTSNLSGAVGQLTAKTSPPQVLLQNRCVAKANSQQSTFILAGRDALPADPDGWLSSPVAMEHWTEEDAEEHASWLMVRSIRQNQSPTMIASTDKGQILSLRGVTPPGFLVQTFATGSTGCPS